MSMKGTKPATSSPQNNCVYSINPLASDDAEKIMVVCDDTNHGAKTEAREAGETKIETIPTYGLNGSPRSG